MQVIGIVSDTFNITGRGVGVFFAESPQHIAHLAWLDVVVARPDGSSSAYTASREFARKVGALRNDVVALVIRSATTADVPLGSVVSFGSPAGI